MTDRWWLPLLIVPAAGAATLGVLWAVNRKRGMYGYGDDARLVRFQQGKGECPYCRGSLVCERQPPPSLCNSWQAYSQINKLISKRQVESFWVFVLDARNRFIGKAEVARGALAGVSIHPREVFAPAVRKRGAAIIVAHNHPSRDTSPSPEDDAITHRLVEVGKMIGIPVLDHLVIARGSGDYFSYRDHGKMGG